MIKIVAENFVKPELKETFLEYVRELAEKSQAEEGNISYNLHEDLADSYHLTFIEFWKDQEAIDLHNASEHFTTIVPKMRECAAQPGRTFLYKEII